MSSENDRGRVIAAKDPAQLIRHADTLVAVGRAEEAVRLCRQGLALRPDDVNIQLALGRALSAAGHLEEAQEVLLAAMSRKRGVEAPAPAPRPSPSPTPPPTAAHPPAAPSGRTDPTQPTLAEDILEESTDADHGGAARGGRAVFADGDGDGEREDATQSWRPDGSPPWGAEAQRSAGAARVAAVTKGSTPPTSVRTSTPPRGGRPIDVEPTPLPPSVSWQPSSPGMRSPTHEGEDADFGFDDAKTAAAAPQAARARQAAAHTPAPSTAASPPSSSGAAPARRNGRIDLDGVARALLRGGDDNDLPASSADLPRPEPDAFQRGWARRHGRAFVWLWVGLALVTAGSVGGFVYHKREEARRLGDLVAQGDAKLVDATYAGDAAARDAYAQAVRISPKGQTYYAMLALAAARLHTDQGEDTDAAAWAMLKRAEKEAARHPKVKGERTDVQLRQARALLALGRAESCPSIEPDDGDIGARCALQKGDIDGARKILAATIANGGDKQNVRALLVLASLELGAGDLDAADAAYRRVLAVAPDHPRAVVGRAMVALERGETPEVKPPPTGEGAPRIGVTTEAWFHLARANVLLAKAAKDPRSEADQAAATKAVEAELALARKGIVHDGRLALLYGRARLLLGQISEAEQAMRVAERLDPNDADVAVLDAEVALAKGFEEKVVSALSVGPQTPRRQAVLGRAQVLVGKYKEAIATLDAALARRPGDATAITYRAIARARAGDAASAMRELEKAAAQLGAPTPHYGLGLIAYERKELVRARTELARALERNSEAFRARALLGRVLRDQGKTKEALVELERAAREAPALTQVHATLGHMYLELGRNREARAEIRKVLDAGPGKATADDKLTFVEASLALGFVEDAEGMLGEVTAPPKTPQAARVARLKLIAQSWKGAKEALVAAKALEKDRKGPAARDVALGLALADAYRRAGDLKKAADTLRTVGGDTLHVNLGLGKIALAQGDGPAAETAYRTALQAWNEGPFGVDDRTEARVGLARALLLRKAMPDAIAQLEPCLTDDATAPEPRYWLARAHVDAGAPDKARPHAEKAVELDDHYVDAWMLLGDITKATAKERAKQAYKKVVELAPESANGKAAKRALASLK
jgi:tetratricopeptide (TPR) repeat protein